MTPSSIRRDSRLLLPLIRTCFLIGVLIVAVQARVALPLPPFSDPDSWSYIAYHYKMVVKNTLELGQGRTLFYSSFFHHLLEFTKNFDALTAVQHGVGLLSGGILYLAWLQMRRSLRFSSVTAAFHEIFGAVILWIFLTSGSEVFYEHSIRPEGILAFGLALLLFFTSYLFLLLVKREAKGKEFLFASGALFIALIVYASTPRWIFLTFVVLIPMLYATWFREGRMSAKLLQFIAPSAVVYFFLLLPQQQILANNPIEQAIGSEILFAYHIDLVAPVIEKEIRGELPRSYDPDFLTKVDDSIEKEFARFREFGGSLKSFSFNPDTVLYGDSTVSIVRAQFGDDRAALKKFYDHYFWRAVRNDPRAYLKKVARQLKLVYSDRRRFFPQTEIPVGSLYRYSIDAFNSVSEQMHSFPEAVSYLSSIEPHVADSRVLLEPDTTRMSLSFLQEWYFLVVGVGAALSALLLAISLRVPLSPELRFLSSFQLFLVAVTAAATTACAAITTLEVNRYSETQLPIVLFVFGTSIALMIALVEGLVRKGWQGISAKRQ